MKKYFAPGRVNLMGDHIDYNGGKVLPAAISLGITATVQREKSRFVRLHSDGHPEKIIDLEADLYFEEKDGWANYPKGVLSDFLKSFEIPFGLDIHYNSTLPEGSGLSSSAAIEVLTMYILYDLAGEPVNRRELALRCQAVENHFIGVNCGVMDQYAVANGRKNHALLLDCNTVTHTEAAIKAGKYSFVIMNSCKPRKLIESKYNERRAECEESLRLIQKKYNISTLTEANEIQAEACINDKVLLRRARHVITEHRRVEEVVYALNNGNFIGVGELMNRSHFSLRDDYAVSGMELDTLFNCATATPGCIGSRMTGAGFGGCAIALVETDKINVWAEAVKKGYLEVIGHDCEIYPFSIEDGVHVIL